MSINLELLEAKVKAEQQKLINFLQQLPTETIITLYEN